MKKHFSDIVEDVKQLDSDEKLELRSLLEKYLIAERRKEIQRHHAATRQEESRLVFTDLVDALRESLAE
ncbi:MAG TPA: hypothetical protein DHU63_01660 [Candidatus Marinimicrobia bacterium]|nr:hypothetical protein [Candidatus Neomarinimicrobiota bacterium]